MQQFPERKSIVSIQYLRGLAALGVVFCHYGSNLNSYPKLSAYFSFGQAGVHLFFLISGFIIVYSLTQSGYKANRFLTFLLKRSLRIDPPYYVVIFLSLLLFFILSRVDPATIAAIPVIPAQLAAHLLYVVPFTRYPFYDHVFWTLSVEFQFYVLIGLGYFLWESRWYRYGFLVVFAISSFITWPNALYLVFNYAAVFSMGISLVAFYKNKCWRNALLPGLFLFLSACKFGPSVGLLLLCGSLLILFFDRPIKPLGLLGDVSYSLYLTHSLVIIVLIGVSKKLNINMNQNELLWLFVKVTIAVAFSGLFYVVIEKPSLRLSKHFFYKKSR